MKFSPILAVLACAGTAFTIPLSANSERSLQQRDAALASRFVANQVNTFEERTTVKSKPKVTKPKTTTPKAPKVVKPKTSKPRKPRNPNPVNLSHTSHPKVGESGAWFDSTEGVTKVFYGDDLKVHGAHVAHHEAKFPAHAGKTFGIASGASRRDKSGDWYKNGEAALHDLNTGPGKQTHKIDPKTGKAADAFDEKPWASLNHGGKSVSVVRVPAGESSLEGAMSNYAKSVHKRNPGSKGIKIIDNRTNKIPLDPSLILKKRDLFDDLKNKTANILGDAKNVTERLMDDIQNDFDSFRSKMESVIAPAMSDIEWVGQEFQGFISQDTQPENHQLGIFWHGMNAYDDVMAYYANSTNANDRAYYTNSTNLAYEVACLQLHNATTSKTEAALAPFSKALVEWNNGSDGNSTTSDDGSDSDDDSDDGSDDESDDDSDSSIPSNKTGVAKPTGMIPVNLPIGSATGTFAGHKPTELPFHPLNATVTGVHRSNVTAVAPVDTTCTEELAKATSSSFFAYSSVARVSSVATPAAVTTTHAIATPVPEVAISSKTVAAHVGSASPAIEFAASSSTADAVGY